MGIGGIDPPLLTSAVDGGEWSASCPDRFIPGGYPLVGRRLGGPQNLSGRCGVEKNVFPSPGIEPRPCSPYHVAIPTEPSRLNFKHSDVILS
jgi:hypothetical protein